MANEFYGPGGTAYALVGAGPLGRVGIANLGGCTRVRVEAYYLIALNGMGSILLGWKQPSKDNLRFSLVVADDELKATLATARKAVGEEAHATSDTLAACADTARILASRIEALRG